MINKSQSIIYTSRSEKDEDFSLKNIIVSIRDWFKFLRSKIKVIVLLFVLGGLIGFAYTVIKKPKFTATCTFVLDDGSGGGGLGQYAGLASMVGLDVSGGGAGIFQGDNILELYKSHTMVEKTLLTPVTINGKKKLLIDRYIEVNDLRDDWKGDERLANLNFDKPGKFNRVQDSIINEIIAEINKNSLSVAKPDKKLSIIKVDVTSKDEFFSKMFNDEIVRNVNDFYAQTKTKKSLEMVKILQQKVDSLRYVMNGAIARAAYVSDATPNLNLSRQSLRQTPVQRSQFSIETSKATLSELLKNLELSKITLKRETPLIEVIDKPDYPLFKPKSGKIKFTLLGAFMFSFLGSIVMVVREALRNVLASS